MRRGTIKVDVWTINCGINNDHAATISPMRDETPTQEARRMGWQLTRTYGWICPECYAQEKASYD